MEALIFLVFIALVLALVFGKFSFSERRGNNAPAAHAAQRQPPLTDAAQRAMQRAGYQADPRYVQVADMGLLAYRHTHKPRLVREGDVLLDTNYLRPFVELRLPHAARGTLRFELLDHTGQLRYADEAQYNLKPGKNTLLPGTWLPLEDKVIEPYEWQLRVSTKDTLLAEHRFGWRAVGGGDLQRHVQADGEISLALVQALEAQSMEGMSLSELLDDQEDWAS
jgi:hypothetical protein